MSSRLVLLIVGALLAEGVAFADPSVEIAGGVAIPAATDDWKGRVDTGWKIAARGTTTVSDQLAVVGIEFARFPTRSCAFDRGRLMVGLAHNWMLDEVSVSARIAVGPDLLSTACPGGFPTVDPDPARQFDLGVGGELAATVWLVEGVVDVGIEVGLPLAVHWHGGGGDGPNYDYVGMDLDLLLAFRIR